MAAHATRRCESGARIAEPFRIPAQAVGQSQLDQSLAVQPWVARVCGDTVKRTLVEAAVLRICSGRLRGARRALVSAWCAGLVGRGGDLGAGGLRRMRTRADVRKPRSVGLRGFWQGWLRGQDLNL